MELETISIVGYFAPFYTGVTEDQVINQMKLYITDKIYNTHYGDLVSSVTSNTFNTGVIVIEMNKG